MQDGMPYLMSKREAAQRFGQVAAKPDEVLFFVRVHKAICPFWIIGGMEGHYLKPQPICQFIEGCCRLIQIRAFHLKAMKKLARCGLCCCTYTIIHDSSLALLNEFSHICSDLLPRHYYTVSGVFFLFL